jgi:hypothetical protein
MVSGGGYSPAAIISRFRDPDDAGRFSANRD